VKKTTSEQPQRDVMSRYRSPSGQGWALLTCGHEEPADDLPMATRLRCTTCLPVRHPDAPELPPVPDTYGRRA
jgi:hypothetical protein